MFTKIKIWKSNWKLCSHEDKHSGLSLRVLNLLLKHERLELPKHKKSNQQYMRYLSKLVLKMKRMNQLVLWSIKVTATKLAVLLMVVMVMIIRWELYVSCVCNQLCSINFRIKSCSEIGSLKLFKDNNSNLKITIR